MGSVAVFCSAGLGNFINFTPVVAYLDSQNITTDLYMVDSQVPDACDIFSGFKCIRNAYHCGVDAVKSLDLSGHDFIVASIFYKKDLFGDVNVFCAELKEGQHEVEANFEALRNAIKETGGTVPAEIPETAVSYSVNTDKIIPAKSVGIHAGWGGDRKSWERKGYKYWGDVAKSLWRQGYKTVTFGTDPDRQGWEGHKNNLDLIGKLPIIELGAAMRQLVGFASADSGLAHYASAIGIKSVVLFGPTLITKNRPWGKTALVIAPGLECAPCQKTDRWELCTRFRCMEYDPKDVAKQIVKHIGSK